MRFALKSTFKLLAVLATLTLTSTAHAELSFKDAEGDEIGVLHAIVPLEQSAYYQVLQFQTIDGYLMDISAKTGEFANLYPAIPDAISYRSSDCTGQAYIYIDVILVSAQGWPVRGGQIVQVRTPGAEQAKSDIFVRLEWTPQTELFSSQSYLGPGQVCTEKITSLEDFIPVTVVDPLDYKIKLMPSNKYGFPLPFAQNVVKPDGVFCNSFESCPP